MRWFERVLRMNDRVCPWWLCYSFDNPLRRLIHDPERLLEPYVKPGMTAVDIGCGMGHSTAYRFIVSARNGNVLTGGMYSEWRGEKTMEPKIAKKGPYMMEMQPGKYFWCSCGQSANQPFCDGSHERLKTGMTPLEVEVKYPKTVAWCGCKHSKKPPYCDGAHNKL